MDQVPYPDHSSTNPYSAPTSPGGERPSRVRWLIFALSCGISGLLYVHRYAWGIVKPAVKQETGWSDITLGWLDSATSATYAACQVPGGLASDLLGPRRVLAAIILLWSVCLAWIGAARGLPAMIAARLCFGGAQAAAYPALAKVSRSWFPLSIRTTVQGSISASGRIGGACAALVVGTLLMGVLGLDWRQALWTISGLGLLFSATFWLLFRNAPAQHPGCNQAERDLVPADLPAVQGARPELIKTAANAFNFGVFLLHGFTSTFVDMLYQNWVPLFLREEYRLGMKEVGMFTMLPLLGGALGGVCGGALNDAAIRLSGNRRWSRSAVGLSGKVISAGLLAASVSLGDGRLVMAVLFFCKFFTDWSQPTQWATVTDISGRASGTVFGVVNTVGASAGFLAGPLIGYLIQSYGWSRLFYIMAGIYVVSGMCWLFIDCTRPLFREATAVK
jgi:sugar phosphate permease